MKKRLLIFLTVVLLMVTFAGTASAGVKVNLDGKQLAFDVQPAIDKGRVMVPLRVIFESLGAGVSWNDKTKTAVAQKENTVIKLTLNSNVALKNGAVSKLDVPVKLINSMLQVGAENLRGESYTCVEYAKASKAAMLKSSVTYNFDKEIYTKTINGKEFSIIDCSATYDGVTIHQQYYTTIVKGYAVFFVVSFIDSDDQPVLEQTIQSIKFN